jgi:hypothetical protein
LTTLVYKVWGKINLPKVCRVGCGVDPTLPPPTRFGACRWIGHKHYSIAANPIFQIPAPKHPTPLKILKNFQGTMSNVGHGIIKKAPAVRPGLKEANLKEKQQNKKFAPLPKRSVH